jgi:uncharacterized membrane protein YccC
MAVTTGGRRRVKHSGRAGRAAGFEIDPELPELLARLARDLERFASTIAVERRMLEHRGQLDQPLGHPERISTSVTELVAELQEALGLLRRLPEADEPYGSQPSRPGRSGREQA